MTAVGQRMAEALQKRNGGSEADAQHLAAELTGRYLRDRRAFPGVALTVNQAAITAIANDDSYEMVLAR